MNNTPVKIIVIHDDISDGSPIMVMLEMKYGKENVVLHKHSQQGLDYVLNNLGQKMVVLLDKNFWVTFIFWGVNFTQKVCKA